MTTINRLTINQVLSDYRNALSDYHMYLAREYAYLNNYEETKARLVRKRQIELIEVIHGCQKEIHAWMQCLRMDCEIVFITTDIMIVMPKL